MSKKARDMEKEEPTRPPAEQCAVCKQWVSPGLDHLCRPDKEDK